MSTYFIGDVQGCLDGLLNLLDTVDFNPSKDQLLFCGDLVNRGPQSLEALRYIFKLNQKGLAQTVLGNHDIHLLAIGYGHARPKPKDTLTEILQAKDAKRLLKWLSQQPLNLKSSDFDDLTTKDGQTFFLSHAGLYPLWSINQAHELAAEAEADLSDDKYRDYLLKNLYGNKPDTWSNSLEGIDRLRFIINASTRMRYVNHDGALNLTPKGPPSLHTNSDYLPWYKLIKKKSIENNIIVFGHWSALEGRCPYPQVHAIDTGYVWGGSLTALSLDKLKRFEQPA